MKWLQERVVKLMCIDPQTSTVTSSGYLDRRDVIRCLS